ncbi:hypothetical protein AWH56_005380 [Anaerobacillus isosaccharinicus]|uniref:Uncharacterized protein n=1 Tax=Anaerobacillus isosaccharinicus TaxID=1532552 RepID=A0A1S2MAY2_9BACI|nr:hypothetical protein [Anaerobacillus isosaccharinicus]MBA5584543.1 hypothetical protein [Anaerobacillus isosaccharinicus]QOY37074.1 hypothetical protein AWH56_005380 [Anaerobacillus isosaccharinicus]
MNADKAREIASENARELAKMQFGEVNSEVKKSIKEAANKGLYETRIEIFSNSQLVKSGLIDDLIECISNKGFGVERTNLLGIVRLRVYWNN